MPETFVHCWYSVLASFPACDSLVRQSLRFTEAKIGARPRPNWVRSVLGKSGVSPPDPRAPTHVAAGNEHIRLTSNTFIETPRGGGTPRGGRGNSGNLKDATYITGRLPIGEHVSLPFIATLADESPEVVAGCRSYLSQIEKGCLLRAPQDCSATGESIAAGASRPLEGTSRRGKGT